MLRSRAHKGGIYSIPKKNKLDTESDVLNVLQEYIMNKFNYTEVAQEIKQNKENYSINLKPEKSTVKLNRDGELAVTGCFKYEAKNHDIQSMWRNKFEIRETQEKYIINVDSWH